MINVFLDELPTEWNGYEVNTSFRIGIQLCQLSDDTEMNLHEKAQLRLHLLFGNEDGTMRPYPQNPKELGALISWFLTGWFHDRNTGKEEKRRLMDYDIDQWRIHSDFLRFYRINLSEADLHWWEFQGLLWNLPSEGSAFMQCLELRQKKPRKNASPEERKLIADAHKRYDLEQIEPEKVYTEAELANIDEYDRRMAEIKKNRGK